MEVIPIEVRPTKADVQRFLKRLSDVLNDPEFNSSTNLLFIQKSKNLQTLANLDYGPEQVIEHLRTLTVEEFSETLLDKDNEHPPYLWVFGRTIDKYLVYIKIKIREKEDSTKVVCISFHEAEYPMRFSYK